MSDKIANALESFQQSGQKWGGKRCEKMPKSAKKCKKSTEIVPCFFAFSDFALWYFVASRNTPYITHVLAHVFAIARTTKKSCLPTGAQRVTDEGRNRKFSLYNLTCHFLVTKKVTKEVPLTHAADPAPRRGVLLQQPR